ncbi:hypothetical protein M9458_052432 [Cirrhinus mrigala]|uniref:ribonuclease H n=1 Tax=Cirrhinus mrigala TaxID=683832 RepID=A0ABD0MUJ2_CIRMR
MPFVDSSCPHCERMSMAVLRLRLSCWKRLPSVPSRPGASGSTSSAATLVRKKCNLSVTVRNAPTGQAPRKSDSSRRPVELLKDGAGSSRGKPCVSFGAPEEDRMSIVASEEGLTPDEVEEIRRVAPLPNGAARGYTDVPQVERAVAVHLCPQNAATWKNRPRLPSKACKLSSALAAKAYSAAGQAASAVHAMAILQVHQAQALKQLHEGRPDKGVLQELRTATDFALRATKVTARSLGQVMATMVVQECHLWLKLAQMADADKVRFLEAPVSQASLFGDTVQDFAQQFSAVQKQTEESSTPQRGRRAGRGKGRSPLLRHRPQQEQPTSRRSDPETGDPEMEEIALRGTSTSAPPGILAAATDFRVSGTHPFSKRANFSISGSFSPDSSSERRSASSDSDSGFKRKKTKKPGTEDVCYSLQPGSSVGCNASHAQSSSSPWLPHRRCVSPSVGPTSTQVGGVIAAQPFKLVDPDGPTRLHDSVHEASAQVQGHLVHICPFGHRCLCPACGDCGPSSEGHIEPVPPAEMKLGFYSPYFIIPKKNDGLRPILDLRVLNRSPCKMPFKMLTPKRIISCIWHQDWFTAINLKDAYFHVSILPRHRPFLRFAFEGRAYQYKVLPFGLALSPQNQTRGGWSRPTLRARHPHSRRLADSSSLTRSVVRAQGSGASAPQSFGASGQLGEEQALPRAEHLFSRDGAGFSQHDGTPQGRARAVSAQLSEPIQTQHGGPSKHFSEAPGAYGSCSRGHAAQLASYETTSAEMGMAPWHISGRRYPGVSPPFQPMAGVPLGQVRRHVIVNTDASRTGWGAVCNGQAASDPEQDLDCSGTSTASSCWPCFLRFVGSADAARGTCVSPHGQHGDGRLYQSPRGFAFLSHVATRPPSPLESQVAQIATCRSHSRRAESCSRCAFTSAYSLWRMATPSPSGPVYLEPIQGNSDRSVCLSRIHPLPVVLFPDRGSTRHGCPGTPLAPGSNQVRLSPSEPPGTNLVQDQGERGAGLAGCTLLAHPDLVPRTHAPRDSPSLEDSPEEGPSFSGDGHYLAPVPRSVEASRVASGRPSPGCDRYYHSG